MGTLSRIDRKSSIEMEPLTLNFGEIHFAREAALYVLNTMNKEAASNIFTEGLEPVVMSAMTNFDDDDDDDDDADDDQAFYHNPLAVRKNSSKCSPRDVSTAPF